MQKEELLPCLYCGSTNLVTESNPATGLVWRVCMGCGLQTRAFSSLKLLNEYWNSRDYYGEEFMDAMGEFAGRSPQYIKKFRKHVEVLEKVLGWFKDEKLLTEKGEWITLKQFLQQEFKKIKE